MVTSGLRIGTPALATRGFAEEDFRDVADIIARTLIADDIDAVAEELQGRVATLAQRHPLYPTLTPKDTPA
jgi:glycine hydroxymethyltransferase